LQTESVEETLWKPEWENQLALKMKKGGRGGNNKKTGQVFAPTRKILAGRVMIDSSGADNDI